MDDGLTGRNTTDEQDDGLPYHRDKYHDLSLPAQRPHRQGQALVLRLLPVPARLRVARRARTPRSRRGSEADRVFGKLNWQINAKNKLMFAYHDDYYRIPCAASARGARRARSRSETGHNPSPNVTYTRVISDKTYVEAR